MLSVKKCKKILEDNGNNKYTDNEVMQIREFLYNSAKLVVKTKEIEDDEFK